MKSSVDHVDLRVRRTRKLLWDALMAELSERPFEEITVKDLCERAMTHRTTFYKHFEDKYALLEQGMRQMYDDLLMADEHAPPCAYSIESPPPYFVRLFEHAAQHQQFYRLMLRGEGTSRFHTLLKEYIIEAASARQRDERRDTRSSGLALAMHAHYVAGAGLSLIAWWLENDMPLTPRQMAQYLLAPHGLPSSSPSGG